MLDLKKLVKVRKEGGFTQEDIALGIGKAPLTIFRYESGKTNISFENLEKIVDYLNEGKQNGSFVTKPIVLFKVKDFIMD